MEAQKKSYKRVMLKLSGEALANDKGFGIDPEVVYRLAGEIKEASALGIEISVVVDLQKAQPDIRPWANAV